MGSEERARDRLGESGAMALGPRVVLGCALLCVGLGTSVLLDYWLGLGVQPRLLPGVVLMKPNSALCAALLGGALLGVRTGPARRPLALGASALSCSIALLSLIQLATPEFGIDSLLVAGPAVNRRLSPITGAVLLLVSIALSLASTGRRTTRLYQGLLVAAALLSLFPALGYLYHARAFYSFGAGGAVAPLTVLALLSLLAGCVAARVDEGLWPLLVGSTPGSHLMRRGLPAVLVLPVLFGWIRLEAAHYMRLNDEVGAGLITTMTVVAFASLLSWAASRLRAQDLERRVAVAGLQNARNTLEARVEERTRVLKQTEVELRRAADQLLVAKESAEAAMRARADFLARMSHEMRTPLNGVAGMLEIALRSDLSPAQRDHVLTARTSADVLLSLINDILDFSKIDAGKLELASVPFRMRDCLASALRESAHAAHQKGLDLYMTSDADVPDCLVGDPQRLRQVMTNLVSNAVKFTAEGKISVEVAADGRGPGSVALAITVSDTGVGIAREKQTAIFEAFAQADESTTRRYGGTGLGLAVSAQLVQLMGGKIGVESAEGQGARFFFTFRATVDEEAELLRRTQRGALVGKRALLIEPHQAHRALLLDLLRESGASCVEASVQEALHTLAEATRAGQGFALLVADDIAVSAHDGFLPALRGQMGEAFPVLLLTLATPVDTARRERLLLASAQLTKPVVPSDLLETIQGLVAEPRAEPEQLPAQNDTSPLTVLLAEDNEVNRRVATFLLEDAGYTVVCVDNGVQALAALATRRFDAVLMDGNMPEMDGLEATRQQRERELQTGQRVPIIALTAQAMKGDRERYLAAGMDAYLTKPFEAAQLLSTLRDVVGRCPPESARKLRNSRRSRLGSRSSAGVSQRPPPRRSLPPVRLVQSVAPPAPEPAPEGRARGKGNASSVYQRDQLLQRLRGQVHVLRTMVTIFDEEVADMFGTLSMQVDAGAAAGVELAAHKLAGALLTVSAEQAATTARMLETSARARDLSDARALCDSLRAELETLRQAFLDAGDLAEPARSSL